MPASSFVSRRVDSRSAAVAASVHSAAMNPRPSQNLVLAWLFAFAAIQAAPLSLAAGPSVAGTPDWTDAELTSVAFVDPQHGWAVGSGGVILHTNDGGATWNRQAS